MNKYIRKCKKKMLNSFSNSKGLLFHFAGLCCLIWFLIRVVPKPDRIRYPCQQMSLNIAVGYIAFWGILWSALFHGAGLWIRRAKHKSAAVMPLFLIFFVLVFSVSSNVYAVKYIDETEKVTVWMPESDDPIGTPYGLNPGRVVWVWNPDATQENLQGYWWMEENNNQEVIDEMFEKGILSITDDDSLDDAWDSIFTFFNEDKGYGTKGYQAGEKIAIKVNLNNCWNPFTLINDYVETDNDRDASPYVVKSLLRHLINIVGIAPEDITVYDASRPMPNWFYNRVYYKSYSLFDRIPEFEGVHFVDNTGRSGREKVVASNEKIYFADGTGFTRTLPTCVVDAKYLINIPILKRHPIENGVTLSAKNYFGTWMEPVVGVHNYHKSGLIMGNPAPQVDLLSHEHIGGKTMLFIGDGLYATKVDHSTIAKFDMYPFNGDWTNSLFFSQDPVAIDSVMYDFLHTEGTNPIEGSQNYMHQAAEPTLNHYDPENDGEFLSDSLGVHEHWNRSVDIFSPDRYQGVEGNGIDFVAIPPELDESVVKISTPEQQQIYFNGRPIFSSKNNIIIGDIDIVADVNRQGFDVEKVEFYINDELVSTCENSPYIYTWDKISFSKNVISIVGYFDDGKIARDYASFWKFG